MEKLSNIKFSTLEKSEMRDFLGGIEVSRTVCEVSTCIANNEDTRYNKYDDEGNYLGSKTIIQA